jgi:uncharacterized protein
MGRRLQGAGAVRGGKGVGGARRLAAAAAALLVLGGLAAASRAEEAPGARTIVVFGDSQAAGLARGLQRVLVENPHYRVLNRTHPGAALVHGEREWLAPEERFVASGDKADIAIAMFGANDRLDMRLDDGAYLHFRMPAWRRVYAARVDRILALLVKAGLKIVWCGNPIARSPVYSDDMRYINAIYAAEVGRFGGEFVPLWGVVADDAGHYTAFGKDREGTTERLRGDDGIHFTAAGYEVVAEKLLGVMAASAASAAGPTPAAAAAGAVKAGFGKIGPAKAAPIPAVAGQPDLLPAHSRP